MSIDEHKGPGEGALSCAIDPVLDAAVDTLVSIPAPLRKTAWGVFSRITGAYIDKWVAKAEREPALTRAYTAAEVQQIKATSAHIAAQIQVPPEFPIAAWQRHAEKIVMGQQNLVKICDVAHQELVEPWLDDSPLLPSQPHEVISDDWLNTFEAEGAKMSSDYMQRVFGKVLAREIRKPGSVSLRTVRLTAQLDRQVAEMFATYCSMASALLDGKEVGILMLITAGKNPVRNALSDFGLSYRVLLALVEYGLINSSLQTIQEIGLHEPNDSIEYLYCGERWKAFETSMNSGVRLCRLTGIAATIAGTELYSAVTPTRNLEYETLLTNHWKASGFRLERAATASSL
ncbi:MAG: DUF2806 domain-containing protein [Acidovorax sp.]|uniref:DUF2806 domain-containing protein n=1 Tax=Acidovorax sp. TaxID=1872122 RepID=UPI00391D2412